LLDVSAGHGAMSAIEIDAELRNALTRFRAARPEQSGLERELDAVVLVSDVGGDALLTMDGRLIQDSPLDGVTEITSLSSRRVVLVLGAQRIPGLKTATRAAAVDGFG
jgi:hypothetical protein